MKAIATQNCKKCWETVIGVQKGRKKRGETVPERVQVPLSVSQLTPEQFGAAAPEFV